MYFILYYIETCNMYNIEPQAKMYWPRVYDISYHEPWFYITHDISSPGTKYSYFVKTGEKKSFRLATFTHNIFLYFYWCLGMIFIADAVEEIKLVYNDCCIPYNPNHLECKAVYINQPNQFDMWVTRLETYESPQFFLKVTLWFF